MMANPWRGEVALVIDDQPYVMRLTLGALASLEAELRSDSLVALVERFESGAFKASDVIALLRAGLKGGGHAMSLEQVMAARIEGGPMAAAQAAAELLKRAFTLPEARDG